MSDHYCCKRCGQRYDKCDCPTAVKGDHWRQAFYPTFWERIKSFFGGK